MGVNGIYGLSGSGLDIESMVKVGMMSRQSELNKMQQQQQLNTWKKESLTSIYSDVSTFNYTTLTQYKLQSNMNAMGAKSSDESTVTVTANGAASAMSHKVTVNSLSSNAYLLTANKITRDTEDENRKSSIYLGDNVFESMATNSSDSSMFDVKLKDGTTKTVNGSDIAISFTVTDGSEDLDSMAEDTRADYIKNHTVSYTYAELSGSGKTYNDLAADINALGTNIKASYDSTNDSFSMYNGEGGKDNSIGLIMNSKESARLFTNLGLAESRNGGLYGQDKTTLIDDGGSTYQFSYTDGVDYSANMKELTGQNGSITIDGKTYNDVTGNRITVAGVTYNMINTTAAGANPTTVTVTQDTDAIIDRVKSFVEDYNKILNTLYDKYSEEKFSDYKPLTDSQKEQMSEEQIKKWEEKAKSGILYHDSTIGKIIDRMREAVATPVDSVDSAYNSAYAVGIYTSKTNGEISLDEDRLKKALAADPDSVYQVFGSLDANDDYAGNGVAQRLGDVMVQSMKELKSYAGDSTDISDGSSLGNLMLELQTKISNFKTMMSAFENALYKKYDAMEVALSQLGTQLGFITGGQ